MSYFAQILLAVIACGTLSLPALAQPDPGPGGGGPSDPPRSTPELDPATLSGMAAIGYFSLQAFKNKRKCQ